MLLLLSFISSIVLAEAQSDVLLKNFESLKCTGHHGGPHQVGDRVDLLCKTDISADLQLKPAFQWYRNGQPVEGKLEELENGQGPSGPYFPEPKTFIHTVTVTAEDHQVPFKCQFQFEYNGEEQEGVDSSDPGLKDSCEIKFDVLSPVYNTSISPSSHDAPGGILPVLLGDRFECTASGFPTPTYLWKEINLGDVIEGPELVVSGDMLGHIPRTYNCTAYSNLSGQRFEDYASVTFLSENYQLRNMVVPYGSNLTQLFYTANMTEQSSVQWTFTHIDSYGFQTMHQIYFAKLSGGGVLPEYSNQFRDSQEGYGVIVDPFGILTRGKYKYYHADPPNVVQKEFSITGTSGLTCRPDNNIIEGELLYQDCFTHVSNGNLVPEFAWYRNGKLVEGELIKGPNVIPTGVRWAYVHRFVVGLEDLNATFTCRLNFRYEGTPSRHEDTSNPGYTEGCSVVYYTIEYSVRNVQIFHEPNTMAHVPTTLRVGDRLACYADGYPEVTYEWKCEDYPIVYGNYYTIIREMVGQNTSRCECTANNTLSNGVTHQQSAAVEFNVAHESGVMETPIDTVVPVGDNTTLQCTNGDFTSRSDQWVIQWAAEFYNEKNTSSLIYFYNEKDYGSSVLNEWLDDFEDGNQEYDLTVKNATYDIAGTYFCQQVNYPLTNSWQAELAVTSPVRCMVPQDNLSEGDSLDLVCQLEYTGNLDPEIHWYADDVMMKDGQYVVKQKHPKLSEMTTEVKAKGVQYKCVVHFGSHENPIYSDECHVMIDMKSNEEPL